MNKKALEFFSRNRVLIPYLGYCLPKTLVNEYLNYPHSDGDSSRYFAFETFKALVEKGDNNAETSR